MDFAGSLLSANCICFGSFISSGNSVTALLECNIPKCALNILNANTGTVKYCCNQPYFDSKCVTVFKEQKGAFLLMEHWYFML